VSPVVFLGIWFKFVRPDIRRASDHRVEPGDLPGEHAWKRGSPVKHVDPVVLLIVEQTQLLFFVEIWSNQ